MHLSRASSSGHKRSRSSSGNRASAGGRPSLMPLRVKNDGGAGGGPPGGSKLPKPRTSGVASSGGFTGRQSYMGGRNSFGKGRAGQGLMDHTKRRSSVLHYGAHHEQMKDPRPIGDKSYKDKCIRALIEFLAEQQYPFPLSAKLLHSPTQKDFVRIFEFLNGHFHPKYKCGAKIEDEIPRLLKSYGYPFPISKSTMFTVGSPHTWPHLLAALTWMKEQIQISLHTDIECLLFSPSETEAGFDIVPEEKILLNYVEQCYGEFLRGSDDYTAQEQELERKIRDNSAGGNLEALGDQNRRLKDELERLEQQPDELRNQQKVLDTLNKDLHKVNEYMANLQSHKQQTQLKLQATEDELMQSESEYQQLEADIGRKQQILATQELSPVDVERINADREALRRKVAAMEEENNELDKQMWALEIDIGKKHDVIEKKCREFNRVGHKLQLLPSTAENAFGVDYELNPVNVQQHKFHTTVKPALMRIKHQCAEKAEETFERQLREEEDKEQITDMLDDESNNQQTLEAKHKRMLETLESDKQAKALECENKKHELESLEQEVLRLEQSKQQSMHKLQEAKKMVVEEKIRCAEAAQGREEEVQQYTEFISQAMTMVLDHKEALGKEAKKMTSRMQAQLDKTTSLYAKYDTDTDA